MRVFWVKGSEQELMKKPERKEIHIVLAGLEKKTPWKSEKIGLSMPYFKKGKDKRVHHGSTHFLPIRIFRMDITV